MKVTFVCLFVLAIVSGCSSVSTQTRPASYYQNTPPNETAIPSLFPPGNGNLSNAQIDKLLDYKIELPKQMRIGIVQLGDYGTLQSSYMFQQNYTEGALQSVFPQFISTLRKSSRVYDASYIPSMLLPSTKNIASLRSAAAHYQADLLLLYQSRCDLFNKVHIFSPNEVQADCIVQSALVDVRSGIVIFSSVASEKLHATKAKTDINFDSTVQKARVAAVSDGLDEIAKNVDNYLAHAPELQ